MTNVQKYLIIIITISNFDGVLMEKTENQAFLEQTDEYLVARAQSGDEVSLQVLLNKYRPTVSYLASGFSVSADERKDLIQEGLIALYFAVKVYDAKQSSFKTFASLCAKRAIISALRKTTKTGLVTKELALAENFCEVGLDNNPETSFINRESFNDFSNKIKSALSEFEYSVLTAFLKYSNYTEICENLDITRKEADNALQRARRKIKKLTV